MPNFKPRAAIALATAVACIIGLSVSSASPASAATVNTSCPSTGASSTVGAWSWKSQSSYSTAHSWCAYYGVDTWDYRVVWQSDGNLVVYNSTHSGGSATWASNTQGRGAKLVFQTDGNLVIYNRANRAIWNSNTFNPASRNLQLTYKLYFRKDTKCGPLVCHIGSTVTMNLHLTQYQHAGSGPIKEWVQKVS